MADKATGKALPKKSKKKVRLFNNVELPDNLYPDCRGRVNHWRYRRPDGKWKTFKATIGQAKELASQANLNRDCIPATLSPDSSLPIWIEKFIEYRENLDPVLKTKASWSNRQYLLRDFGNKFSNVHLHKLNLTLIRKWWDTLTAHGQRSRRCEFNRLFNYLMLENVITMESNPFSTADDKPRVMEKRCPTKRRKRLTLEQYNAITKSAVLGGDEFLKIAMDISLFTGLRRGDICSLRWDTNIQNGVLYIQVSKSHEKHGADGANLSWNLNKHPALNAVLNRARTLAMENWHCPYVISRSPVRRFKGRKKEHVAQVIPDMVSDTFHLHAQQCGIQDVSFHEVRALSSYLYSKAGYEVSLVQELMAHTSASMTEHYQKGHEVIWREVEITLPEDLSKLQPLK